MKFNNEIEVKINEFIRILRDRPSLLIVKADTKKISTYITFFEGFFLSLKMFDDIDVERKISNWYQDKVKIKAPNMYWFAQFEMINSNISENEMIIKLLDDIESFFLEDNG